MFDEYRHGINRLEAYLVWYDRSSEHRPYLYVAYDDTHTQGIHAHIHLHARIISKHAKHAKAYTQTPYMHF